MIEIIWTYRVREEHLAEFERFYRADGVWSQLFLGAPEYRGTILLRDKEDPLSFATVDSWDSLQAYEQFMRAHREKYQRIDAICAEFTVEEKKIGLFERR